MTKTLAQIQAQSERSQTKLEMLHNRTAHLIPEDRRDFNSLFIGYVTASIPLSVWNNAIESSLREIYRQSKRKEVSR